MKRVTRMLCEESMGRVESERNEWSFMEEGALPCSIAKLSCCLEVSPPWRRL